MSGWGLLAPLINNLSNTYGTGDAADEKKRKDAQYDTLELEQRAIQARVEGAKAAGLHPLAALGFQAGPSVTSQVGSTQFSADHFRGVDREPKNEGLEAAQVRLLNAQADEAEANSRRANYALATQPGNGPPNMSQAAVLPTERENTVAGQTLPGIKVKPNEILASQNGTTIGTHPSATEFRIPGGPSIALPSESFAQATEDLDLLKYFAIAWMNKDRLLEWGHNLVDPNENRRAPWKTPKQEADNLLSRHPPKGDWAAGRRGGGRVRY